MKKLNIMLVAFLFILTAAGCASKQKTAISSDIVKPENSIKTVSVATFDCSDSLIAQNIKSKIIESLLSDYSVVIGDEADAAITGTITLSHNTVSEVRAEIMRGTQLLTTVSVLPAALDNFPEVVGRVMGDKIRDFLSRQ